MFSADLGCSRGGPRLAENPREAALQGITKVSLSNPTGQTTGVLPSMSLELKENEKQYVILVDDEEALLTSLTNRLQKRRPGLAVKSATNGADALELVKSGGVNLLVTDIAMEGMNGTELILLARQVVPDLPVIVMTAYPTADLRYQAVKGSIAYFDKPFDFELLLNCVDELLAQSRVGFSGAISAQTLSDIVQLYALSNATGALHVHHRTAEGVIWFDHGNIVHARTPTKTGVEAFYETVLWSGGRFSMSMGEPAPKQSIHAGWAELLIESCRIQDELKHQTELASGPVSMRGWSMVEAAAPKAPPPSNDDRGGDFSQPHVSAQLRDPPEGASELLVLDVFIEDKNVSTKEKNMDYKRSVSSLSSIDGFIGAAIVDSESGMSLAQEGGGGMNLELAAGGNTEVVRAKRKVMRSLNLKDEIEDILISLGKQYHLIRPIHGRPTLFLYLALDRSRANLALARMTLADVEKELGS